MAAAWRTLVAENPMAIEVSRFRRRFLEGGRGKGLNTTILVLAIIAYAGLLLVVANVAGDLPPGVLIMAQTLTFVLIAPALMYSAIAGEREKRTWDLLLAAPVTHAQIIVGKFLAGVAGIGTAFVLFLVPTIFTAITYKGDLMYRSGFASYSYDDSHVISGTTALLNEEIISITFALLVLSATLLFSARCRRALMSLGIVLTSLFLGLLAFPALVSIVSFGERGGFSELLNFFHPFMAIERLEEARRYSSSSDVVGVGWYGIPQGLLYLFLTGVFLVWAYKTVDFADGEKKFIPRKPNA
jgi:ABC-type transport system involved in multi-copper enzyme maturation permease subunit